MAFEPYQQPVREPGRIGYIRQDIPEFDLPAYPGERYGALVPETLDLQERATLAVNVLTRATDPEADHEIYFSDPRRAAPEKMKTILRQPVS